MEYDRLMFYASRYATTPLKRSMKEAARRELRRRGPDSLRYLVGHAYIRNIWFQVYARELVDQLEADDAVPVLLDLLDAEKVEVRRLAVFLLGFYDAGRYADRVVKLLDDPECAGAAVRTLGKWRIKGARKRIEEFLAEKDERRRIAAANALRDIGDPAAAAALIRALDDDYFTVRFTAARALESFGRPVERPLISAMPHCSRRAQRLIVRILGRIRSRRARRLLRKLQEKSEDEFMREDAARALRRITGKAAGRCCCGWRCGH